MWIARRHGGTKTDSLLLGFIGCIGILALAIIFVILWKKDVFSEEGRFKYAWAFVALLLVVFGSFFLMAAGLEIALPFAVILFIVASIILLYSIARSDLMANRKIISRRMRLALALLGLIMIGAGVISLKLFTVPGEPMEFISLALTGAGLLTVWLTLVSYTDRTTFHKEDSG
ncbi:MAG: hypothetical protein H5T41_02215 [Methanomassiliicoccales archaeon]|nr:hypothetical protein [Methanomassiliicoccales archaeon]